MTIWLYTMISTKEFVQLDNGGKKQVLITVFSQLPIQSPDMQEVQDLLQLDFPYQNKTLDSIFASIESIITHGAQSHTEQLSEQAHKAHELLEKEAIESADEADDILTAI